MARHIAKRIVFALAVLFVLRMASLLPAFAQSPDSGNGEFAAHVRKSKRPRLTVVISIDQFRADYLRRLNDLFLPASRGGKVGGFRYLMTEGSCFLDARYNHIPTATGPGHSIILTGANPALSGIIANEWWDKTAQASVYCVDDARQNVVGAVTGSKAKPMGPKNLRVSTVGDELKLATNGAAKVVTLALKDRAAILLGGHAMDASIWFDDYTGRWISSSAYCKSGKLPTWVEEMNARAVPEKSLGKVWQPSVPTSALARALPPNLPPSREPYNMGRTFPHPIGKEKTRTNFRAFTLTPFANEWVFETAKAAVTSEKLGQRGESDLLAINLSTNDYVGHAFGPYSPEATDLTVQTDRFLSDFLNFLNKTVPGGLKEVVFVVTADHGVVPIVENLQEIGIEAGRTLDGDVIKAVQNSLSEAFGGGYWIGPNGSGKEVGSYQEPYIFLNEAAIADALKSGKATSRAQIETTAAQAVSALKGIYTCFTRSQILEGRLPQTEMAARVLNDFYPKVAGDLVVISEPMWYTDPGTPGPYATSHGTPYIYDSHVPILIAGPGIRPGVWTERVAVTGIAPTLCTLLGIEFPSGCEGVLLKSALK